MLEEAGGHTEYVRRLTQVRTGNAIIQRDRTGDNSILLYGGANRAITREQVRETLSNFEQGDLLVLQNEINGLDWIWEEGKRRGMRIAFNPSPADEALKQLPLEQADYLILNEIEAAQLLRGNPAEQAQQEQESAGYEGEEMAERLAGRFPASEIILTLGGDGSVYRGRDGQIRQQAYRRQVADTTAAGDTFTGYFIAGLWRGMEMAEIMRVASMAASIAVSREGAASSIPTWEEVERELEGSRG